MSVFLCRLSEVTALEDYTHNYTYKWHIPKNVSRVGLWWTLTCTQTEGKSHLEEAALTRMDWLGPGSMLAPAAVKLMFHQLVFQASMAAVGVSDLEGPLVGHSETPLLSLKDIVPPEHLPDNMGYLKVAGPLAEIFESPWEMRHRQNELVFHIGEWDPPADVVVALFLEEHELGALFFHKDSQMGQIVPMPGFDHPQVGA